MKLHNFFISDQIGDKKEIMLNDSDLFHQLRTVFRYNVGSQVVLLDNSGFEFVSEVTSFARGSLEFHVLLKRKNKNMPAREVYLFQSVIKKDKFEWVLEKGTEVGVTHFAPVLAERSEKKKINTERGRTIIKEASEQSGRGVLSQLFESETLEHIFKDIEMPCVAFHGEGGVFKIDTYKKTGKIGIFIGPEGGWSERELSLFYKKNVSVCALGHQTLRSETAAIVASALFLLDF